MRKALFLLAFLLPFTGFAGVIKGVVRDSLGEPVPYVVIGVKNTSIGAYSNLAGGYFLELKAGNYTLVFSQIGYQTQEHNITIGDDKVTVLDITMHPEARLLTTFEVRAKGNRDRGKEIMHNVVDHRDDYWNHVENYKCNTYQKSSLEKVPIEKPYPVAEVKPDTTKEKQDSAKAKKPERSSLQAEIAKQNLTLIETVSETYFRAPNEFHENILACHDYADQKKTYDGGGVNIGVEYGEHDIAPAQYSTENPYLMISDAASIDFNFYRNYIDAPSVCTRPLISPASSMAFLNYKFDLLDSFLTDGKWVYKINVTPLFPEDALFSGLVFVQDSTWAIVSVNLCINPGSLIFCKEFCLVQDYNEVQPGIYLPVRREFTYTIKEGKFNIIGNLRVDHSDYTVNADFPAHTFSNEVKHYNDDAFDKDSAYWSEHRTIQLEDKEIHYVHTVDSLVDYYTSEAYLSSEDSAFNHVNVWSFLLNGVGHRNRATGNTFFFNPLIADCVPFGVGGYRQKLGGYYQRDFTNGFLLETEYEADYGFANRDLRGKAGVGLTYFPRKFVRTFVRFGDSYDMINNYASLETVFSRSNYVRDRDFSVAQRMEIVNGLFGELTFEYSDQFPITGMNLNSDWTHFAFGSLNTPADFVEYKKAEIRFELKYRFKQKYIIKHNRKIIIGTKYPEVRFLYRKGIHGLMDSEVNYDYIEIGSNDQMRLGRWGTSEWNVLFGSFVNKKDLRLLEYKFFRGSDSYIFSDPMLSFQLLGLTAYTSNTYFYAHYMHHFEGAFGSKIPYYRYINIQTAFGAGILLIPDEGIHHEEFFVGLERPIRIRKQLFRVGVYAVTADNNFIKPTLTYKFGITFYNTFTHRYEW